MIHHRKAWRKLQVGLKVGIVLGILVVAGVTPEPAVAQDKYPGFINVSKQRDMPPVYRGPEDLAKHLVQMNGEVEVLIKSLGLQR